MMSGLNMKDSIRARILAILGLMGLSYVLLLAVVELTATATTRHMDRVSNTLIPGAMQMVQAEASFEQMKKRYKEAVLLEEPAALADAEKDSEAVAATLNLLRAT